MHTTHHSQLGTRKFKSQASAIDSNSVWDVGGGAEVQVHTEFFENHQVFGEEGLCGQRVSSEVPRYSRL